MCVSEKIRFARQNSHDVYLPHIRVCRRWITALFFHFVDVNYFVLQRNIDVATTQSCCDIRAFGFCVNAKYGRVDHELSRGKNFPQTGCLLLPIDIVGKKALFVGPIHILIVKLGKFICQHKTLLIYYTFYFLPRPNIAQTDITKQSRLATLSCFIWISKRSPEQSTHWKLCNLISLMCWLKLHLEFKDWYLKVS